MLRTPLALVACSSLAFSLQGGDPPVADFLGGYGNDDVIVSPYGRSNTADIDFLPPERGQFGPPAAQQTANVFLPPGPTPRDGWPVLFMTLFGGGSAIFPVDEVEDGQPTDRLWEALNAGIAVVNWGAPPVGGGRGMFFPPGHPSGRYESFARSDDNNYKDSEWVIQFFKQSAQTDLYGLDPSRMGVYGSSQSSQNLLWATMGPERARATGSAQATTSTRVQAIVAIGTEGSIWAYDQGPNLGINAPQLLERMDMPGVPADELGQVDEQLQKDASFTRWMSQTQDAIDNNVSQPVCFLYVEPVKMVGGTVADTTLDAFGDPNLHDTIGQPDIHDSWNFIVHVNKLLGLSQASLDFHLTDGNSVFGLDEDVAATLSPPFDVYTETYGGGLFGEEQTKIGIDFMRRHLVLPLAGDAPLRVRFSDESDGDVDAWTWDFGDGATSSAARPVHTYRAPGTYDVTLTVSGPDGSSTKVREGCVVVGGSVAVGVADAGFEGQVAGGGVIAPWLAQEGTGHAAESAVDGDFPTEGVQWLVVSGADTAGAVPPPAPGGSGPGGVGGAGVGQSFTIQPGRAGLRFDAAFLLDGPVGDPTELDWMSVDVTDGATRWNLYYADANSDLPDVSAATGLPMTATSTVSVDLAALFPSLDATTVLTLLIEVGDGGDGSAPSFGYVDRFEDFVPASSVVRNGTGANALCFADAGGPVLGQDWTATVDTTGHPGATLTGVVAYSAPLTGIGTPFGELLVAVEAFGGVSYFASVVPDAGGSATHVVSVPLDLTLEGLPIYSQGLILGGGAELCNALDLVVGQ